MERYRRSDSVYIEESAAKALVMWVNWFNWFLGAFGFAGPGSNAAARGFTKPPAVSSPFR